MTRAWPALLWLPVLLWLAALVPAAPPEEEAEEKKKEAIAEAIEERVDAIRRAAEAATKKNEKERAAEKEEAGGEKATADAANKPEDKADGQPRPADGPAAVEVQEQHHEVRLKSGTVLVGRIEPERWTVRTSFGTLEVPVADMKQVRFGRLSDPERIERVRAALALIASEHPDERARARKRLKAEGAFAAQDLAAAAKEHDDPEVQRTCKELLEEMKLKPEQMTPDEDRIETSTFPIRGRVGPDSFKVTVEELGELNVHRSDIVRIRLYKQASVVKVTVSGTNMWPNGWVDTGVKLKKGEKYRITATGRIRFPNWGNRTFTPEGDYRMGNINGIPNGSLGARISSSGKQFKAGASHTGVADRDGTLQVCLMANMRGHPTDGEFKVSIQKVMD